MRTKLFVVIAIVFLAYALGSRARKGTSESAAHQIIRLWNEPKARRARQKRAKRLRKEARKRTERAAKLARTKVVNVKKALN